MIQHYQQAILSDLGKISFILKKATVNDQIKILKILDNRIKSNQVQYDLGRKAVEISALSSKDLLEKYEYLTGEDLGHKPSVFEKANFKYSPLGMSLCKVFRKDEVKSVAISKIDFNYDSNHTFYRFCKVYDEFEEMPLDSKYNRMKEFNKFLISFKAVRKQKNKRDSKRSE